MQGGNVKVFQNGGKRGIRGQESRARPISAGGVARFFRVALYATCSLAVVAGLAGCATPAQKRLAAGEPTPGRIAALRLAGPPARVLLISVAGLEASDYLAADGFVPASGSDARMPRLAELAAEGVIGESARPPSPGSAYASIASLVTGRAPVRHGVVADVRLEKEGTKAVPFWDRRMLEGEALWDAAIGRGVMALGWPTTIGARIELLLPEAARTDRKQSWLDFMRGLTSPVLMRDLEEIASDSIKASKRDAASWPLADEKDAALTELACGVALSDRDPGLWLVRFTQTETSLRRAGRRSREHAAALRNVDAEIGSLIDCLDTAGRLETTALFVVGDVAYRSVHTRVDPNVSLVAKGLIGRDPRSSSGVRSWLAIVRSHGRSAYVYAKDASGAVEARKVLEREALRTRGFRIVPATELAEAGVDPQAWFGLEASPGFEIGNGLTRPTLRPANNRASPGALWYVDDPANAVGAAASRGLRGEPVGFVAWGRGIRARVRVPELDIVDVAPTIAALLGLRLEGAIDGTALFGILRAKIPPPPPGPKRLGVGRDGDVDGTLRDLGGGRGR